MRFAGSGFISILIFYFAWKSYTRYSSGSLFGDKNQSQVFVNEKQIEKNKQEQKKQTEKLLKQGKCLSCTKPISTDDIHCPSCGFKLRK